MNETNERNETKRTNERRKERMEWKRGVESVRGGVLISPWAPDWVLNVGGGGRWGWLREGGREGVI